MKEIQVSECDYQEVLHNHNQYQQTGLQQMLSMNLHCTVQKTSDTMLTSPFSLETRGYKQCKKLHRPNFTKNGKMGMLAWQWASLSATMVNWCGINEVKHSVSLS